MSPQWGLWRTSIVLIAIVAGMVAVGRLAMDPLRPADASGLQSRYFVLGGADYQILLPARARLESWKTDHITFRHDPEAQRTFALTPVQSGSDEQFARSVTLTSQAVLKYTIANGGTAELEGRLQVGRHVLAVTCRDERAEKAKPDWCVPYLHHLKGMPRGATTGAVDPAGLQRADFTLGDVRYRILLPQGAPVRLPRGRIDYVEIRHPHTTRAVRMFRLGPASGESDAKYARTQTLSSGAVLDYTIARDIGGGSGGTEGELEGRLKLGAKVLSVSCHDQAEHSPPVPEWCVPFLHHLVIDDGS